MDSDGLLVISCYYVYIYMCVCVNPSSTGNG